MGELILIDASVNKISKRIFLCEINLPLYQNTPRDSKWSQRISMNKQKVLRDFKNHLQISSRYPGPFSSLQARGANLISASNEIKSVNFARYAEKFYYFTARFVSIQRKARDSRKIGKKLRSCFQISMRSTYTYLRRIFKFTFLTRDEKPFRKMRVVKFLRAHRRLMKISQECDYEKGNSN